jgi:drug/metabolite transporter (DMT)-like permease
MKLNKTVAIFILLSALIFATMEVALKIAGSALDPFQMTFLRFMTGGLILLPFGIWEIRSNHVKVTAKALAYFLLLGTVCIPVSMILFQMGVMNSNASTAAVIFCANPLFTMIFAHFFSENDKLNRGKATAAAIVLPGILMMMRPWDTQPGDTLTGSVQMITSALTFGLYSALNARTIHKTGAFAQTSLNFILGALVLLIMLLIGGRPVLAGIGGNIPILLYVGVVVTGCGYLLYFLAIRYSNATTGSVIFFLKPIIAPVVAVAVLSEKITWNMYAGIALILAASYLLIRQKTKSAETPR